MALFRVTHIIDGDTIKVSPNWVWDKREGDIVKVLGYTTPQETNQAYAIDKLSNLILNKNVELKAPQYYTSPKSAAIGCRVYLNGVDVSKYFPEFNNF